MGAGRFLGVFVPTVYLQYEGVEPILDRIQNAGGTAVCLYPRLGRPAQGGAGERFPDLHIDGFERILDRPLWGRRDLDIETFPAFESDRALYGDTPYRPATIAIPQDVDRQDAVVTAISSAHRRGLEAHLLIHPLLVPGLRDSDTPRSAAGRADDGQVVARSACPSSPDARRYAIALARDTVAHAPDVDGLFLDWTEFRAYALGDLFGCICSHCGARARAAGYSWDEIVAALRGAWQAASELTPDGLLRFRHAMRTPRELIRLLAGHRALLAWIEFKARTVTELHREVRAALDADGAGHVMLTARGWAPPWNLVSGLDYERLPNICGAVAPKIFTFDYAAIPRWYGRTLADWNPRLPEELILDALVEVLDLPDDRAPRRFAAYQMPAPGESHPTPPEAYATRIEEVAEAVAGRVPCYPIIHAYLPEGQWKRMVAIVRDGPANGTWVQMYGYLSDPKLRILRDTWRARAP